MKFSRSSWLPSLPGNRQTLLILLPVFLVAYVALVMIYYQKTEQYAIAEAQKSALDFLLSHKAVHRYVAEIQRPEIYRLQDSGQLYKDYFSPKVMSFTYIARSVKELINKEREKAGLPAVYFKLATDNPRNPVNQADEFESALLARMNRGEVGEISEVVQQDGKPSLHVALPIDRSSKGCLKCHGDPKDAPAELLALYGDERGFHESPNSIRALISIRIPLDQPIRSANNIAGLLSAFSLMIMVALYGLIHFFVLRIDREQRAAQNQKDYAEKLLLTSNALVVELDTEGKVTLINPASEQITGYSAKELIGKNWFATLVPQERYPAVWKMFRELSKQGVPRHFENPILTKNGVEHYIIWQNSELHKDGRLVGVVSFGIDMTENREISQRLAEQDIMMRNAQHVAHIGSWRLNHVDQTITWSDEMYNIFEVPFATGPLLVDTWFSKIHPEDRERVQRALTSSFSGFRRYELTYRISLPGEQVKYIRDHAETQCDADGHALTTLGVAQDFTEQVLTEMAIRESEIRFRTVAEFTYDWEYWQGLQGEILFINPACQRISGYSQADFISKPSLLFDIVHPDERQLFIDHHKQTEHNDVSSLEFRIITKDGQERWLWHGCRAVFGPGGQALGRRASNRDITDRKAAELELENYRRHLEDIVEERTASLSIAKEAAEAANKAKTAFLATMSHELRTPMNGIMGLTKIALRRADDPKLIDLLAKISQSSDKLLAIINDILDYSKLESERFSLEVADFKISAIIDPLVNRKSQEACDKGLQLITDIAPQFTELTLRGDANRLGHILGHLTSNAIQFTRAGQVTVRAQLAEENTSDVLVRFEVIDTGIGISMDDQKQLFSAFEQADSSLTRQHGGIGLGLALSKRLAQTMGGEIGVASKEGIGSTFWFTVRLGKQT
ncbi:MAG: PAS domain-containing protein [Pseudomonadota bacterium]